MHWPTPDMYTLPVPMMEKILRSLLVYLALILLLRVFGKRELAQLNPFDLVVLMTLSNTVQNAIIGSDNSLTGGLLGALTLLLVNYLVVRFLFRHRRLDQMIIGNSTVLIQGGHILRRNLAKEMLSETELRMVAHRQGYELNEVEECVLEPAGGFFIKAKAGRKEDKRWTELVSRLDAIGKKLDALEKRA
ncbi:MAG: DUF421 domain-containing protein [Acidobacteria bacterium]|nr:DUF421 domain-containing protein [Acidobacteriota bacterium]